MELEIRKAIKEDLVALTDIYNQAICFKNCTCDTEIFAPGDRMSWFQQHENEKYPIFTCLLNKKPIGYSYFTAYRPGREAVEHVAEISYYLDFSIHGQHIGSQLMEFMLKEAHKCGITVLLAILLESNQNSIKLLQKYGFTEWGRLPQIVSLNGRKIDHLYYGKHLDE